MKKIFLMLFSAVSILAGAFSRQEAHAFVVPAALIPFYQMAATASATTGTWTAGSALAAGVGGFLLAVGLRDDSGNEVARVSLAPTAAQDVPAGWTAGTIPSSDPIPPASGTPGRTYGILHITEPTYGSPFEAAEVVLAVHMASFGSVACKSGEVVSANSTTVVLRAGWSNTVCPVNLVTSGVNTSFTVTHQDNCPPGYSLEGGGVCALVNPTLVPRPSDGKCETRIAGGAFVVTANDPDCASTPAGYISEDGKTLTLQTTKEKLKVQIQEDGSISVTEIVPNTASPGQSTQRVAKVSDPSTGDTPSQLVNTTNNTIKGVGEDALGGSPQTLEQIEFPSDYAREGTLQQVPVKIDQLKNALLDSPTAPTDPTSKTISDIDAEFFPSTFGGILGWSLPSHTSTCPDLSFDWESTPGSVQHITFNSHCSIMAEFASTISVFMIALWTILAMMIVLGA